MSHAINFQCVRYADSRMKSAARSPIMIGGVCIARWHGRHDGSIGNAEIFNAVNAKLVVDYRRIVTHLARTYWW